MTSLFLQQMSLIVLSRCKINTSITVSQAKVNDDVNSPVVVDSGNDINKGVMNSSPLTLPQANDDVTSTCLLYTSPSPRDRTRSRMPSSA